jgi:cytochrome c-type protein NapB
MPESPDAGPGRLLTIFASVIAAAALIGFVTGIHPDKYEPVYPPVPAPKLDTTKTVPVARSHTELASNAWGADETKSGWTVASAKSAVVISADPADRERARSQGPLTPDALRERGSRRAFEGVPPTIPHPISQGSASECMACHEHGFQLGSKVARPIPHPRYDSCTQCHVVSDAPFTKTVASDAASAVNEFSPAPTISPGPRAYAGAPPQMPHTTWMRETCLACHGDAGRAGLRTRHPERQSCTQCHTPSAPLEQAPVLAPGVG